MKMFDSEHVARFRDIVAQRLGLHFDEASLGQLSEVMRDRLSASGCRHPALYLDRLALAGPASDELHAIANRLTVAETYFFRHPDHFRAFSEVAFPERLREQATRRRQVEILSAGCASGEEPYTLAMLVRECASDARSCSVSIRGIDVSSSLVEKAARGAYTDWSLRATPDHWRQRSFRTRGREHVIDEALRKMVSFEVRNLMSDDPGFWQPERFDIIFFRNVSIYFAAETTKAITAKIIRSLVPGGFLFLGPSETLRGLSNDFHLRHTQETFYYQKRRSDERPAISVCESRAESKIASRASALLSESAREASWVEAISQASARIASLANRPKAHAAGKTDTGDKSAMAEAAAPRNLAQAWEMLREDRYEEALRALEALPPGSQGTPDTLLLRGAILTNAGRIGEAREVCLRVLAVDELNAGAHYLTALCMEHAGDRKAALEHDKVAAYLDPDFGMPHLHMGLLARRAGDIDVARRELNHASALLEREEASSILLFGGGFGRETLIQLCRAELRGCGGAA